jgi:hypothetical protein
MLNTNNLDWLQQWYISHCNGEWEDYYFIKIETLDNPGWVVKIDLGETELENRAYERFMVEESEDDWIDCSVKDGSFVGAGDPTKLDMILTEFRRWAERVEK